MRKLYLVLVTFVTCYTLRAQTYPNGLLLHDTALEFNRYGGHAAFLINQHDAQFAKFNDIGFCCPHNFGTTLGQGFSLGALFETQISGRIFLDARAGFSMQKVAFTQQEQTVFNNPIDNSTVQGVFEYRIESNINQAFLDILPSYRITDFFSCYLGLRTGFLITKNFAQQESIVSPDGFVFLPEKSAVRNKVEDDIPEAKSLQFSMALGVSQEFPLNRRGTTLIAPEVFVLYGLGNVSSGLRNGGSWKINSVQAGVSIRFSPNETVAPDIRTNIISCEQCRHDTILANGSHTCIPNEICPNGEEYKYDSTTKTCRCIPTSSVVKIESVRGIYADGRSVYHPQLEVQEFDCHVVKPLLPYLFFKRFGDQYSCDYRTGIASEQEILIAAFKAKPGDAYQNILNIVGSRMKEAGHSNSVLTIIGCNAGSTENNDSILSRKRAEKVRGYFANTWRIPLERLKIVVRSGLPATPTSVEGRYEDALAVEENARVELTCNDKYILEPFEYRTTVRTVAPDTLEYSATLKTVSRPIQINAYLRQEGPNKYPIDSWEIDSSLLQVEAIKISRATSMFLGKLVPDRTLAFEGTVRTSKREILSFPKRLDLLVPVARLSVAEKTERSIPDTLYAEFNLILFDFNSDQLDARNQSMVDRIRMEIKPTSVVVVEGTTDIIGSDERNQSLSERRAKSVAALLPNSIPKIVIGNGIARESDNKGPDQRFYNRTVRVVIKTPIRSK